MAVEPHNVLKEPTFDWLLLFSRLVHVFRCQRLQRMQRFVIVVFTTVTATVMALHFVILICSPYKEKVLTLRNIYNFLRRWGVDACLCSVDIIRLPVPTRRLVDFSVLLVSSSSENRLGASVCLRRIWFVEMSYRCKPCYYT